MDEMLRYLLVYGIDDERTQRRLFAKNELLFAWTLEIASATEAAGKVTREITASKVVDTTEEAEGDAARLYTECNYKCSKPVIVVNGQDTLLLNEGLKKPNFLHARKWDTSVRSVDQTGKTRNLVGL